MNALVAMLIFPGGLFLLANGVFYEWVNRKLLARLQNRAGPRWFQPVADIVKLLSKEDIAPEGGNLLLFIVLPVVALAAVMTAALYVPAAGLSPAFGFQGDLIVTVYLLGLLTLCIGLAGVSSASHYSMIGATRLLTQLFAYEAPFMLALLGPALISGSWQIGEVVSANGSQWLLLTQPIGFIAALASLMGKLELPPFDAPEAETEIVAGALTEYGGRGLALFSLAKNVALVVGLTLIGALYMGGFNGILDYLWKTLVLLLGITIVEALLTRLRIDQTSSLWWRFGVLLVLVQWLFLLW